MVLPNMWVLNRNLDVDRKAVGNKASLLCYGNLDKNDQDETLVPVSDFSIVRLVLVIAVQ